MDKFDLIVPKDFDECGWEIEAKGWLADVAVAVFGEMYKLTFYDATRLAQEVADELKRKQVFVAGNLVVVRAVNRANIELAVEELISSRRICSFATEQSRK